MATTTTTTVPVPPTTAEMIHAIRTVQATQAAKIGAACVALVGTGKTPLVIADLQAEVAILGGLELATSVLLAGV